MLNAFSVSEIRDIVNLAPVSEERLALFREDPQLFGPVECSPLCLDTSPLTASVMRKSPWNRAVVQRLTDEATALVATSNRISARFTGDDVVDWEELFKSHLSDISFDIQMARNSILLHAEAQAARYNEKASRNKKQGILQQKFSTRQRICASMTQHLRETETEQGLRFWTDMLLAVDLLSIDGMSDEETVDANEETVKVVKDLHFRHSDLRPFLAYVDATPRRMKRVFNQSGRKPFRKIISDVLTERPPPPNLPSSFYRPQYLESMKKGLVPWVPVDEDTAISIATLTSGLLEVEDGSAFLER
ncbi:hypothetical protein VKT23_015610 [Stygiomarasmius scandens]|uniref:Uncharacterized protein n=1 Tax=Marasmiellus scandens TaxID=2682957 RepID=A0ABR1J1Z5_9AGAR